ncbi:MAG: SLC13 family permease [Geminicoccaceae bacterium]|nr:MAG: SLC13 family permease [Geminicoccaceae bacterium]
MSPDAAYVLVVLLVTIVLFVTEKLRLDVIALLMLLALYFGGQITPREATAGFGDPVVVLIGGLFVVGEALYRTGIAHAVGAWLVRHGGATEARLVTLMMAAVAFLSAFMSSTGAVAVFIPIALGLAQRTGISRQRLLMPLAVGAMIGGMLTLIGTPPNLVVAGELTRAGLDSFTFFDFTPIGLLVLIVGIAYMILVGTKLLNGGEATSTTGKALSVQDMLKAHRLSGQFYRLQVTARSELANRTIGDSAIRRRFGVSIAAIEREARRRVSQLPATVDETLRPGDVLFATGNEAAIARFVDACGLVPEGRDTSDLADPEVGVVEVLVSPLSRVVGQPLIEAGLREQFGLAVLSVMRGGQPLDSTPEEIVLQGGDVLLLSGSWDAIRNLERERPNLFVLRMPKEAEEVMPARARAPYALTVMVFMMFVLAFDLVPAVIGVFMAALGMVLTRCLDMNQAYRAVNWQSLVLIAGMLPMGTALENSGALQLIVDQIIGGLGGFGPIVVLTAFFLLTSILSQVISNTATTVLVAPVAMASAELLGVSPYPLLMTVAIAASTAFATPVASPINMLVLGPGNYRFVDFVKVGMPLQILAMIVCLLAVPVFFPF